MKGSADRLRIGISGKKKSFPQAYWHTGESCGKRRTLKASMLGSVKGLAVVKLIVFGGAVRGV